MLFYFKSVLFTLHVIFLIALMHILFYLNNNITAAKHLWVKMDATFAIAKARIIGLVAKISRHKKQESHHSHVIIIILS